MRTSKRLNECEATFPGPSRQSSLRMAGVWVGICRRALRIALPAKIKRSCVVQAIAHVDAALLALVLLPDVVMPRPTELANLAGDSVELERQAHRLGPARLLRLLQRPQSDKGRLAFWRCGACRSSHNILKSPVRLRCHCSICWNKRGRQAAPCAVGYAVAGLSGARAIAARDEPTIWAVAATASLPLRLVQLAENPVSRCCRAVWRCRRCKRCRFKCGRPRHRGFCTGPARVGAGADDRACGAVGLASASGKPELLALATLPDDSLAAAASQELCWPLLAHKPNAVNRLPRRLHRLFPMLCCGAPAKLLRVRSRWLCDFRRLNVCGRQDLRRTRRCFCSLRRRRRRLKPEVNSQRSPSWTSSSRLSFWRRSHFRQSRSSAESLGHSEGRRWRGRR